MWIEAASKARLISAGAALCVALCLCASGCSKDPGQVLIAQLQDPDPAVRRQTAQILGQQIKISDEMIAALGKAVAEDKDEEVRLTAMTALGNAGRAAKPAVPSLTSALVDASLPVRVKAGFTIQKIDPGNPSYQSVLIGAIRTGDGRVLLQVGS